MKLRIDGRMREAELRVDGEVVLVRLDGVEHRVGWRRDADGSLRLELEGRQLRAWAEGAQVLVDGRARRVERAAGEAKELLPDTVTPPMPAVVVKVLVQPGDKVERGDRLVVVSAMKTETSLKAPRAGTVVAVRVVVGQNVRPGEELVLVE